MTDLVERLRARADDKFIRDAPLMAEAANEIERLRAEGQDESISELYGKYLEMTGSNPTVHWDQRVYDNLVRTLLAREGKRQPQSD